jgi:hypothetical protein
MKLHDVRMIVHLSCEEASRLASAALDRDLSRSERWGLRLHTLICGSCRRMQRQLDVLRRLATSMPESARQQIRDAMPHLSADRKQQVKRLLSDASRADQG